MLPVHIQPSLSLLQSILFSSLCSISRRRWEEQKCVRVCVCDSADLRIINICSMNISSISEKTDYTHVCLITILTAEGQNNTIILCRIFTGNVNNNLLTKS